VVGGGVEGGGGGGGDAGRGGRGGVITLPADVLVFTRGLR